MQQRPIRRQVHDNIAGEFMAADVRDSGDGRLVIVLLFWKLVVVGVLGSRHEGGEGGFKRGYKDRTQDAAAQVAGGVGANEDGGGCDGS